MTNLAEHATKRPKLAPYFTSDSVLIPHQPLLPKATDLVPRLSNVRFEQMAVWTGDQATRIHYTFVAEGETTATLYLAGYERSQDIRRWITQFTCTRCQRMPCPHVLAGYLALQRAYRLGDVADNDDTGPVLPQLEDTVGQWFDSFALPQATSPDTNDDPAGALRIQLATSLGIPCPEGFLLRPILSAPHQTPPIRVLEGLRDPVTQRLIAGLDAEDRGLLAHVWSGDRCTVQMPGWRYPNLIDGGAWLRRAIEQGKVVPLDPLSTQRVGTPFGHRETAPLTCAWTIRNDFTQKLETRLPFPRAELVYIGGPAWLSSSLCEVQWIDATEEEVRLCTTAPEVPPAMSQIFLERWNALACTERLPKPIDIAGLQPTRQAAEAVFRVDTITRTRDQRNPAGMQSQVDRISGTLLLQYGPHQFEHLDAPLLALSPAPVLFECDRDAIERASAALTFLAGFDRCKSMGGDSLWFRDDPIDPQSDDARRLHCLAEQLLPSGVRLEASPGLGVQFVEDVTTFTQYHQTDPDWFGVDVGIDIDGERLSVLPMIEHLLQSPTFQLLKPDSEPEDARELLRLPDGRHARVLKQRLREVIAPLVAWLSRVGNGRAPIKVSRTELVRRQLETGWDGPENIRALCALLKDPASAPELALPPTFIGKLRDYQSAGVKWLVALYEHGFGGVLADDMGLGKTVQVLAYIAYRKALGQSGPALISCSTSIVPNWIAEAERFVPNLRLLSLHGPDRADLFPSIPDADIVLTTYPLLPRDIDVLQRTPYFLCVADEAQNIKNSRTKAAVALRSLDVEQFIPCTGTPIENNTADAWSLMSLAVPGLLGDAKQFQRDFRAPIEKGGNQERACDLRSVLAPFILRRLKTDVATELPPKTTVTIPIEMGDRQRQLYGTLRTTMYDRVRSAVAQNGLAKSHIVVLDAITKLRQVCCDPRLLKVDASAEIPSAKLDYAIRMVADLIREGRRILLFSQFTSMLDLIAAELDAASVSYVTLTGQTTDRATPVNRFNAGDVSVFLISLKAGGAGLNLVTADTVILYDPWWNPAVEAQAADRAYRIGQDKPVFVYKLVADQSVETGVVEMQQRKGDLANAILEGGEAALESLTEADIERLFASRDA